jgi:S1-C subfamily serine protease
VVTKADGTAVANLPTGNYTVESDEPVTFNGKSYQWTEILDVPAGDTTLELTSRNAVAGAPASSSSTPKENDPWLLFPQWKDSLVSVWTPVSRASGFVIDAAGLVVTNQHAIGSASAVDVQLTPSVKVAARVLAGDGAGDVAVLLIDPAVAATARPVPLGCADGSKSVSMPAFALEQTFVALGAPLRGDKELSLGDVIRADTRGAVADFRLAPGSIGGPVFTRAGDVAGISAEVNAPEERRRREVRIVPIADVCEAVASAKRTMETAQRPAGTLLPVEPMRPFPADALEAALKRRDSGLGVYQMSSSDFDITFLTPPVIYFAQHGAGQTTTRTTGAGRRPQVQPPRFAVASDFGDWSEYFEDAPPVLAIRVMPKLAESFWTTIARGAAYTQGVALPPIKHFKPGFARMRAWCGDVEVIPIHPFILEQRVSQTDAVREGLHVFDPEALGPDCKLVRLEVYSEKDPKKPDARVADPQTIEQVWQDFAPYRAR